MKYKQTNKPLAKTFPQSEFQKINCGTLKVGTETTTKAKSILMFSEIYRIFATAS